MVNNIEDETMSESSGSYGDSNSIDQNTLEHEVLVQNVFDQDESRSSEEEWIVMGPWETASIFAEFLTEAFVTMEEDMDLPSFRKRLEGYLSWGRW